MLYPSACREARCLSSLSLHEPMSRRVWLRTEPERRRMWLEMLGLWPLPERTPLRATVTGTLDRGDYVVEKLHFQSVPGAWVPGNLYRPAQVREPLPAVLYLCGHSQGKVNPSYQAHPRWFGRHGYVALVLDPIQLGEAQGMHNGTFLQERWDWYSRGYTPAGTEVWNAMRALDYLAARPDVDRGRMGVTGLSGGGAISWFLGAADERVRCVVPVCQTGSIEQLVTDRSMDGHCDCAFWINYYRWCTPDIGALIAPRSLLIASGTEDILWRPYAFRDVAHRIRLQYAALDARDRMDLVEDVSPHGYTPKLRRAIFQWFHRHLKGTDEPVVDDVTPHSEPERRLLVFGGHPPASDRMRTIDRRLPRLAGAVKVDNARQWEKHRRETVAMLRRLTFRQAAAGPVPRPERFGADGSATADDRHVHYSWRTEDGLALTVRTFRRRLSGSPGPMVVFALPPGSRTGVYGVAGPEFADGIDRACVEVRNTGATSVGPGCLWTLRRAYALLGQTLPERQVHDLLSGLALIRGADTPPPARLAVYGEGPTAVLAIYAAILDTGIEEIVIKDPPTSHGDAETPELLGILRIGDLPQNLALLYPRRITFVGTVPRAYAWTRRLYAQLGRPDRFGTVRRAETWQPHSERDQMDRRTRRS